MNEVNKLDEQKKKVGEIVVGAILIAVAVWLFLTRTTMTDGKVIGAVILAIVGIAGIIMGIVGLKKGAAPVIPIIPPKESTPVVPPKKVAPVVPKK